MRVHVSVQAREIATCARAVDVWREKSKRAPGSAKAKRPDCPAKVDKSYIRGIHASYKPEATTIPGPMNSEGGTGRRAGTFASLSTDVGVRREPLSPSPTDHTRLSDG